jgi:autotransporter-associated beta strand protein
VTAVAGVLVVQGEVAGATVRIAPAVEDDVAGLGGSGKVGGTALASGAVHSPGSSTGIQTFPSGLTYETGSTFRFELTGNTVAGRGTAYDGVDVGGTLTVQSGVTAELVFDATGSGVIWGDPFWGESRRWKVFDGASSVVASDAVFAIVTLTPDSEGVTLATARPGSFFRWEVVGDDVFLLYRAPVVDADLTVVADGAAAAGGGVLGVEGLDWKVAGGQLVIYMEGAGRAMSIARGALQAKLDAADLTVTGASLAGSEPLVVGTGRTLTLEVADASTYSGVLGGGGTLVHDGAGVLTFTGQSTLGGTVAVAAGRTLVLADGGTLGTAGVTLAADALLRVDTSAPVTLPNTIEGDGALEKAGVGALTLAGASSYTGGTTVEAGTLVAGASSAGAAGQVTSGPFGTGMVDVVDGATLDVAGRTVANAVRATGTGVAGSGGAVVSGGADLGTLAGPLTLTGATTVRSTGAGGIALTGGISGDHVLTVGAVGDTAPVTLGGTVAVAGPLVVRAGTIDLTGTLTLTGTSRLELVTSAAGTITGSGSAAITVDELVVRGGVQVLLVASTMDVTTFAATGVTDLSVVFADGVTIGTLDGVAGVTAAGVVDVRTVTGDLDVAAPVTSTLAALTPGVVLRAGTASPVGTATGGDVRIVTGGSIVAAGAVVEVFSGTADASTGIGAIADASRVGTSVPPVSPGQVGVAYRSGPPVFLSGGTLVFGDVLRVLATDGTGADPTITLDEAQSDEGVCDLTFGTLTAIGVGQCVVVAANASFATEQTITVTKAPQTIVFTSIVPSNVTATTVYRPVAVSSVTIVPDEPDDLDPPDTGGLVGTPGDGEVVLDWEPLDTFEDPGSGETRTTTGYLIRLDGVVVCTIDTPAGADEGFVLPTTCTVTGLTNGETYEFLLEVVAGIDSRQFALVAVTLPDPDAPEVAEVLPVGFAIVEGGVDVDGDGPVCELDDGAVRFLRLGACTVEATQPGDANHEAAAPVRQTLVAGLINRTIRFPVLPVAVLGQPPFLAGADVTTGPAPTFTTSAGSAGVCTVGATSGLVTLVGVGTCTITASSAGDARFTTPEPVTRTFEVLPTAPGAMSLTSVSPGNGSITVGFTLPGNDGGAPVQAVRLRALPDDGSGAVIVECLPVSPCTLEGLVNGTSYTVTAAAVNAAGVGAGSPPSPAVVPFSAPDAVRALRMTPGDGVLDVAWEAPTSFGGGTFVRYEVSVRAYGPSDDPDDDGADVAGEWGDPVVLDSVSARTARFEGLANGVRYDVKVVAVSSTNTEEIPENTALVSGVPVRAPDAPEGLTLTRVGPDSVLATWGVPRSDGGAPITGYTVSPSCTLESPTATSCVLTRVPRGMEVTVAVRAVNLVGPGAPGLAVITLPAPPAPPAPPAEEEVASTTTPPGPRPPSRPGPSDPPPATTVPAPPAPTQPVPFPGPPFTPGDTPRVIVGGVPVPLDVTATPDGGTRIVVGGTTFDFGPPPGVDRTGTDDRNGGPRVGELLPTPLRGDGLLPDSTLTVFVTGLPTPPGFTAGTGSREIGSIAVSGDGSFDGELTVGGRIDEPPIPIGRHVIQVIGFDKDGNQIVLEQTIDVAQHAPRPELDRTTGRVPALGDGEVLATVAGMPAPVNAGRDADGRGVAITGDGWTIGVRVDDRAGRVETTGDTGVRITLTRTGTFTATGTGMQPGSRADVWMFSDATLLGSVTVADDGTFTLDVSVDPRFIGDGIHTLQVQGVGTDGYVRAANIGVTIESPTGLDTLPGGRLALVVLLVVLLGASAFFLIAWRRRDDDDEDENATGDDTGDDTAGVQDRPDRTPDR